jgi:hypothetical protein
MERNVYGQCNECCKFTSTRTGATYYPARGTYHYDEPPDLEDTLTCPKCIRKQERQLNKAYQAYQESRKDTKLSWSVKPK